MTVNPDSGRDCPLGFTSFVQISLQRLNEALGYQQTPWIGFGSLNGRGREFAGGSGGSERRCTPATGGARTFFEQPLESAQSMGTFGLPRSNPC
jgi:hypothetical protein